MGDALPQHVWYNEVTNMRASDVNLVEMGDTAVARRNGDILELDVHVVLG
jgi:hypothetical protein